MAQTLKLLRELEADERIAPQMRAIYDTIKENVGIGEPMDREKIVAELTTNGKLTTRQEPARILGFYLPRFEDKGIIAKEGEAPKAVKTAKTKDGAEAGPSKAGDNQADMLAETGAETNADTDADAAAE